jgi:membrane-bound ClpP family serine protease
MNMSPFIWYVALLAAGLFLLIAEILIPGGIAGAIGALALVGAMGVGLVHFPAPWGFISALSIIVFSGISLLLWVQLFPRSRVGKRITLRTNGSTYTSTQPPSEELNNAIGESVTALRPGGIAVIQGKRYDVLAEGGEWIAAGAAIRVCRIHDGNLIVSEMNEPA